MKNLLIALLTISVIAEGWAIAGLAERVEGMEVDTNQAVEKLQGDQANFAEYVLRDIRALRDQIRGKVNRGAE